MKIGVMVGRFPVISEQFILNHIVGLIDSGHDVTILAGNVGNFETAHPLVDRYALREKTRVAGIPTSLWQRVLKGIPLFLGGLVTKPAATVRALDQRRYTTGAKFGKTLYFHRLLRDDHFDLLHCHFGANGLTGAFLKDAGIAERLVVMFHGSDINTYPRRYGADVYLQMFGSVDHIICNTEFTKTKVVAHGAPPEKISVVPVSLDTALFPERRYAPDSNRFVLLTVGRLVEKKGHVYVLRALAKIRASVAGLRYRVVGAGELEDSLLAEARRLNVDDIVDFLGSRVGDDVVTEYRACDVFVLASVTAASGDMEGQGLVLQEAQALGVPVISTIHNGIPDGVLDGESGLLVPEKDVDALADAIRSLAQDVPRRIRMGRQGAKFVRDRYDTKVVTEQLNVIYDDVFR